MSKFVIESVKTSPADVPAPRFGPRRPLETRVYFWPVGESVWENIEQRRQRPYTEWKKMKDAVIDTLASQGELEEHEVLRLRSAKWRWSQKAGCPCGCSPGFIAPYTRYIWKDIHVNVALSD